jgi:release factor glutamine methyltransferase
MNDRPAPAALAARAAERLAAAGWPPGDARRDAAILARHALGWTAAEWLSRGRDPSPDGFDARFAALVERRAAHEPVAYLTGEREFYGRPFLVDANVLIPRPETELVVEEALRRLAGRNGSGAVRIADLGTGSGCLAVTLALEWPGAQVTATDVSAGALEMARRNAERLGARGQVELRHGSWFAGAPGPFDVVVSNPPYVAESDRALLSREVLAFEPAGALFGGDDGLDAVRDLVASVPGALAADGWLILEIGAGQAPAVRAIVGAAADLSYCATRTDLQGIDRVVVARRRAEG